MRSISPSTLVASAIISTCCAALVSAAWDVVIRQPSAPPRYAPAAQRLPSSASDDDATDDVDVRAALDRMQAQLDALAASDDRVGDPTSAEMAVPAGEPTAPRVAGDQWFGGPAFDSAVADAVRRFEADRVNAERAAVIEKAAGPFDSFLARMATVLGDDPEIASLRAALARRLERYRTDEAATEDSLQKSLDYGLREDSLALFHRYLDAADDAVRWDWDDYGPALVTMTPMGPLVLGERGSGVVRDGEETVHTITIDTDGWYDLWAAVRSPGVLRVAIYNIDGKRRGTIWSLNATRPEHVPCWLDAGAYDVTAEVRKGQQIEYDVRVSEAAPVWFSIGVTRTLDLYDGTASLIAIDLAAPVTLLASVRSAVDVWSYIEQGGIAGWDGSGEWAFVIALPAGRHYFRIEAESESASAAIPVELTFTRRD